MAGLTFSDAFTSLSSKWSFETGFDGLTTFSSKAYDGINPASIASGLNLLTGWTPGPNSKLYGNRPYKGARLSTRTSFSQAYGYFQVQLSASPKGGQKGGLYLSNGIAVAEVVSGGDTAIHTYGLLWTPNELVWFVDGKVTSHVTGKQPSAPAYLILQNLVAAPKLVSGGTLGVHSLEIEGLDTMGLTVDLSGKLIRANGLLVSLGASVAPATFTPPGAAGQAVSQAFTDVFVEDFSALSLRSGGPSIAGYEAGNGRYSIGPYYRNTNSAPYLARGFFENNNVGGNPVTNCYVDPASPDWLAAGLDPLSIYKSNNGVLEIHNKRVTNADGSIVAGMEQVAALFPSGGYAEKWLCGWLTTAHSVFQTVPLYIEHRTQFSCMLGNWPTVWTLGRNRVLNSGAPDLEGDMGEGLFRYAPNAALNFTAHNQISGVGVGDATITGAAGGGGVAGGYDFAGSGGPRYLPGQLTANPAYHPGTAFHTYGCLILQDRMIFSMDGLVLHTAMFTPNTTGGWTIPSLGQYFIFSTGMGGNGGTPTPGVNEVVNKIDGFRMSRPA